MKKFCGEKCEQVLRADFLKVETGKLNDLREYIENMDYKCKCGHVLFKFKQTKSTEFILTVMCPVCKELNGFGMLSPKHKEGMETSLRLIKKENNHVRVS